MPLYLPVCTATLLLLVYASLTPYLSAQARLF